MVMEETRQVEASEMMEVEPVAASDAQVSDVGEMVTRVAFMSDMEAATIANTRPQVSFSVWMAMGRQAVRR